MARPVHRADDDSMHSYVTETPTLGLAGRTRPQWLAAWGARLGLDTAYLLLGLPAGIITFTVVVTGWATALGLAITLIGLPVAMATIVVSRGMAAAERWRAALVLGTPVRGRYRPVESVEGKPNQQIRWILERLKAMFADAQTWKDLGWHLLLLPIGIVGFTVAVVCWAWTLGLITMPLWYSLTTDPAQVGGVTVDAWYWALLAFVAGIVTLPISVALLRATAAGTGALSRLLLGADTEELSERVERPDRDARGRGRRGGGRAASGSSATCTTARRRGSSRWRWTSAWPRSASSATPRARASSSRGARRGQAGARRAARPRPRHAARAARRARAARGDPGARVAAPSCPTTVTVEPGGRVAPAVESAAYFVVAEALTNAVKHSGATRAVGRRHRATATCSSSRSPTTATAAPTPSGSGLTGLRKRVEALDGALRIASPPGGPTLLHAEIPCGS